MVLAIRVLPGPKGTPFEGIVPFVLEGRVPPDDASLITQKEVVTVSCEYDIAVEVETWWC